MPRDFALFQYRREMRLSWSDLTGEYPQPEWRTEQDMWYLQLAGEMAPILAARARDAHAAHG